MLLLYIVRQQASLYNTIPTPALQVDREQPLLTQNILPCSPEEGPVLANIVAIAVYTIHEMSRRQEIPTEAYSRILSTLRSNLSRTIAMAAVAEQAGSMWIVSSSTTWSASMWINTLEAGQARSKEATILNIIE